jgi:hypothetical protein
MRSQPNVVKQSTLLRHPMTLFRWLVLLGAVLPAVSFAQTFNQWLYTNSVHTSQSFPSEEAAHADILGSGGGYQYVTKKAGVGYMSMNQITQKYVAPPTSPAYTSDWIYTEPGTSTPTYSSEAAVVAAIVADLETYSCPL